MFTAHDVVDRARARLLRRPLTGEQADTDAEAAKSPSGAPGAHDLLGRINRGVLEIATEASAFHLNELRTLFPLAASGAVPDDCLRVLHSEVYRVYTGTEPRDGNRIVRIGVEVCARCVERGATRARRMKGGGTLPAESPVFTLEDGELRVLPEGAIRFYGIKVPRVISEDDYDASDDTIPLHDGLLSPLVHHVVASVYESEGDGRYGITRARYNALMAPFRPTSQNYPEDAVE